MNDNKTTFIAENPEVVAKRIELLEVLEKDILSYFDVNTDIATVLDKRSSAWYMDEGQVLISGPSSCECGEAFCDAGSDHNAFLIAGVVTGRIENYIEDETTEEFICCDLMPDAERKVIEMPSIAPDGWKGEVTIGALVLTKYNEYICLGQHRVTFPDKEEIEARDFHCEKCEAGVPEDGKFDGFPRAV